MTATGDDLREEVRALSRAGHLTGLAGAGFVDATVTSTHEVADGLHGAVVAATEPDAEATQ